VGGTVVVVVVVVGAATFKVPVKLIVKFPLVWDWFVTSCPLKLSVPPAAPEAAPVAPVTLAVPLTTLMVATCPLVNTLEQAFWEDTLNVRLPSAPVSVAVPLNVVQPVDWFKARLEPFPPEKSPDPMTDAEPVPFALDIWVAPVLPFTESVAVPL